MGVSLTLSTINCLKYLFKFHVRINYHARLRHTPIYQRRRCPIDGELLNQPAAIRISETGGAARPLTRLKYDI